jgi:hypothetical protein
VQPSSADDSLGLLHAVAMASPQRQAGWTVPVQQQQQQQQQLAGEGSCRTPKRAAAASPGSYDAAEQEVAPGSAIKRSRVTDGPTTPSGGNPGQGLLLCSQTPNAMDTDEGVDGFQAGSAAAAGSVDAGCMDDRASSLQQGPGELPC